MCFSSGVSSGSLGAGSFSSFFLAFSPSASFAGLDALDFALEAFAVDSFGDCVPFVAVFGVDEVVSLILGFLTDSER